MAQILEKPQRSPLEGTQISTGGAQPLSSLVDTNLAPGNICRNDSFLASDTVSNDNEAALGEDVQAASPGRSKSKIALIMLALCMGIFLVALDTTIITTALPTIAEEFDSAIGYTWIGSSYLLASAASQPLWGKISDIWGRKPILLLANFIFFIGSLVAGVANGIGMLIAGRAVQGIGGGGIIVLVQICVSDLFSIRARGAYFSVLGATWALASSLGPILGGVFTEKVSWRWCFYINLPLDGMAFIIIMTFLDLHTPKTPIWAGLRAIDWFGALAIVGGTLMLLFGLLLGGVSRPWTSAIVICLITFGFLTLFLFAIIERTVSMSPIMPTRIFGHRSNIAALLVCFFHGAVFISTSYFLPLYFQVVLDASPTRSGYLLLPSAVAQSTFAVVAGLVIKKTGKYLPTLLAAAVFTTVGAGLYIDFDVNSPLYKTIIYQIIWGIGIGPNFQAPLIALQSRIAPADVATATATYGFVRSIATAISVVLGAVVFNNAIESRSDLLVNALGPEIASQLGGENAGAGVELVGRLPEPGQSVAKQAYADSLHTMWIMYVALAAAGLLVGFGVRTKILTTAHRETKTGLENMVGGRKGGAVGESEKE